MNIRDAITKSMKMTGDSTTVPAGGAFNAL